MRALFFFVRGVAHRPAQDPGRTQVIVLVAIAVFCVLVFARAMIKKDHETISQLRKLLRNVSLIVLGFGVLMALLVLTR
jgi:NADH:ubiquinone oxidoreductase subunit 6 (subunit J)